MGSLQELSLDAKPINPKNWERFEKNAPDCFSTFL